MSKSTLENRIGIALTNNAHSIELKALLAETDAEIIRANANAQLERERALDPVVTPDADAARASMEGAALRVGRLNTLRDRLDRECRKQRKAETLAQWHVDYETLERERNLLAAQLREYPGIIANLVGIFARLTAFDVKLSELHSRRPAGVSLHLREPELVARDLDTFSRDQPPLAKNLQLPDFAQSDRLSFPPPQPRDMSMFSPVPYDPRHSADWAEEHAKRATAAQAERERVAAFYADQQRARERREKNLGPGN